MDQLTTELAFHFNPAEPRDLHGQWTAGLTHALSLPGAKAMHVNGETNHAIIAFGDPATADKVITYVPGVHGDLALGDEADRAEALRKAADAQGGKSAVVLWQDYSPPPDIERAMDSGRARQAAGKLAAFQAALQHATQARTTVVGHSYGSLVAGEAARQHGMRPHDLVLIGSPGTSARHAAQLGNPAHVWAAAENQDPVSRVSYLLRPDFGGNPAAPGFGARRFAAAVPGTLFPGWDHPLAHSSYLQRGSEALPNIGAIAAGHYDRVTVPTMQFATPTLGGEAMTMAFDPAEPRDAAGKWYHGTSDVRQPGELIDPSIEHRANFDPEHSNPQSVYIAGSIRHALHYAERDRSGLGEPHVYEVEPLGEHWPIAPGSDQHQTKSPIRIIREIPPNYEMAACPDCGCPTGTISGQIELAFNPAEPRGRKGRWVKVAVSDLIPYARGTAEGDEPYINQLAADMKSRGFVADRDDPVEFIRQDGSSYVMRGSHRVKAAHRAGLTEITALVKDYRTKSGSISSQL